MKEVLKFYEDSIKIAVFTATEKRTDDLRRRLLLRVVPITHRKPRKAPTRAEGGKLEGEGNRPGISRLQGWF
jgi:hypothetical protein